MGLIISLVIQKDCFWAMLSSSENWLMKSFQRAQILPSKNRRERYKQEVFQNIFIVMKILKTVENRKPHVGNVLKQILRLFLCYLIVILTAKLHLMMWISFQWSVFTKLSYNFTFHGIYALFHALKWSFFLCKTFSSSWIQFSCDVCPIHRCGNVFHKIKSTFSLPL